MKNKLLVWGAKQIVQVCSSKEEYVIGEGMKNVKILQSDSNDHEGWSLVIDRNGFIADIDTDSVICKKYNFDRDSAEEKNDLFVRVLDARGCCVLPGLIDAHTHPVWAGDRVHEFAMKLDGASYMDIHAAGGGINFTVKHTREETEDNLYSLFKKRLQRMLLSGTTLAECKSGYGLNLETELKMLRVISRACNDSSVCIQISSTYCGAHAVPIGMTSEQAAHDIINVQLLSIKEEMSKGNILVDSIDVFCEKGVFDIDQSSRILQAGRDAGLMINFHGDELNAMGAAEMGAKIGAHAISHLEEISDEGIVAMSSAKSVAVLLPTTAYMLRLKIPPVRRMIESGVVVALGSDFNPNAFCLSMPLVMHLACVLFHMSMSEALTAATINAAASLGKSSTHGSLEIGKRGDLLVLHVPRWEHLIYQFGEASNFMKWIVIGGTVSQGNLKS